MPYDAQIELFSYFEAQDASTREAIAVIGVALAAFLAAGDPTGGKAREACNLILATADEGHLQESLAAMADVCKRPSHNPVLMATVS